MVLENKLKRLFLGLKCNSLKLFTDGIELEIKILILFDELREFRDIHDVDGLKFEF